MAAELFVWLAPVPTDAEILQASIDRAASLLGSPVFVPHVTLCTDPAVTTLAAVGSLRELPLSITFTALRFGDDYFHGCYLEAAEDAALRELQARCLATLGGATSRQYPPHLSLAYGVLSHEQRAGATTLVDLPQTLRFDRLELWTSDGPVSSWRKLA
jgi:2'-5' RNA ligase